MIALCRSLFELMQGNGYLEVIVYISLFATQFNRKWTNEDEKKIWKLGK